MCASSSLLYIEGSASYLCTWCGQHFRLGFDSLWRWRGWPFVSQEEKEKRTRKLFVHFEPAVCCILCASSTPRQFVDHIVNVILFNHAGWVSWSRNTSIIFHGSPNKARIFVYYPCIDTWEGGCSYIPGTIHRNHCSTWYYSHEMMFVVVLFVENIIHSSIITENIDTIHSVLTLQPITIHYSYQRQFLPIF